MDMSFYVGALGMKASQDKLNIVSNNLANVNNNGFKPKEQNFRELINYNLKDGRDEVTDRQAGAGVRNVSTKTNFAVMGVTTTNQATDFALENEGDFFQILNPGTGEITYTKDGSFHNGQDTDGQFYLATANGKWVLDAEGNKIPGYGEDGAGLDGNAQVKPGIVHVTYPSRLLNIGDNEYQINPDDAGNEATLVEEPQMIQGAVESSGTDVAEEMTNVIEAQRAMTYAMRVVQTDDELMGTVNTLRG